MPSHSSTELRRIFESLDQNGDGKVTADELEWLLERTGAQTTRDELALLVAEEGLDFDGFSSLYDSLVSDDCSDHDNGDNGIVEDQEEKYLYEAFKVFDLNGDGVLSPEEIGEVLVKFGMWNENEEMDCNRIVRAYDKNSDGFVDFEEFKCMMLAI